MIYAQESGAAPSAGSLEQPTSAPQVEPQALPQDPREAERALIFNDPVLPEGASPAAVSPWVILRMVLVLALAALAIYGVLFVIRRGGRLRNPQNPHLKVLASAPLGANRFVHIVSVGTKAWLLGAGEGGVGPIAEVTDQEVIDALLLENSRQESAQSASRLQDFRELLSRLTGAAQGRNGPAGGPDFNRHRERLKRML